MTSCEQFDKAALGWLMALPGQALLWGFTSLLLAWVLNALILSQEQTVDVRWMSVAYPLAFLAFLAGGMTSAKATQPALALALRFLAAVTAIALLARMPRLDASISTVATILEAVAGLLLFITHLLFDRWVRLGRASLLAAAGGPFLAAVIIHAGSFSDRTYYYVSGIIALMAGASAIIRLSEIARANAGTEKPQALLRALGVAAIAAVFYYHEHTFLGEL